VFDLLVRRAWPLAIKEARDAFSARLIALGQAHDLITQSSWVAAPLREVVTGALVPHRAYESRFGIAGPNVRLATRPAPALALTLHALATNAARYGRCRTTRAECKCNGETAKVACGCTGLSGVGPPCHRRITRGVGSR